MRLALILLVMLVAGCDEPIAPEPAATIGGRFDLISDPAPPVRFARIVLNAWSLTFVVEQATPKGITETRGSFVVEGTDITFSPTDGEPFACTFEGFRVIRCADGVYRMVP